ncbi:MULTISPECIES: hypothetical protein [Caballeronia]|uniref:hypothetical protein n=1 Tax=Caballeronia TaxID=1827195 RepID=UPI001FD48CCC|nr:MULTISPECIES: hypothetical protein [Caballeronia]MDR5799001.1 hypothetical protein [Caballeronia sp. LZ001]
MKTNSIFEDEGRDGQLARALNAALHALAVHDRMRAISEGEEIHLDFRGEIEVIRAALELLGVTREEVLPFPGPPPEPD